MKAIGTILFILLLTITASLWLVYYLIFWPIKYLAVNNYDAEHPVHVLTPQVHRGEAVQYRLDYCKYRDTDVTVERHLVDGQDIPLTQSGGYLELGCHEKALEVEIPITVNPGRYYLDIKPQAHINWLRDWLNPVRVHYRTEYFEVVDDAVHTVTKTVTVEKPVYVPVPYTSAPSTSAPSSVSNATSTVNVTVQQPKTTSQGSQAPQDTSKDEVQPVLPNVIENIGNSLQNLL